MAFTVEYWLSWFALLTTIALFLTGIPTTSQIRRSGTTGSIPFFPYLAGFACTVLWLKYGLLNGDTTVVACNLTGMLLNGYYLGVFCMYTSDIGALKQPAVMVAVYVYGVLIYCRYLTSDYGQAVESLGFASCLGTVAMFGSPLATVKTVIRNRSTASMVFSLCLMNFIVAVSWSLYGFVVKDMFIQAPNSMGALLSLAQLLLFVK